MRTLILALIAVGLVAVAWLLWPDAANDEPSSPQASDSTTTSTTPPETTTTTRAAATTTTSRPETHVVETVEEAEEILRDLWFGWFEGIYNQDEDRIWEVVVLEETVSTAVESFGSEFASSPRQEDLSFSESEILHSDKECLAVWSVLSLSGFREGSSAGVHVVRWADERWKRLSLWQYKEDLWDADCASSLPSS
jgi:hypothetical protein